MQWNLQPTGHLSDGSSIQRHSAGSNYPYIMQVREVTDVPKPFGAAQVIDSMGRVVVQAFYELGNKEQRLQAYERALDSADAMAVMHKQQLALKAAWRAADAYGVV